MYLYPTYWMAKHEMIRLWRAQGGLGLTRCASCGRDTRNPHAHHLYLGRWFKPAARDVRNIVPVCNATKSPECHESRVHGEDRKAIIANRHYHILGNGDPHVGHQIVIDALKEWGQARPFAESQALTPVNLHIPDVMEGT